MRPGSGRRQLRAWTAAVGAFVLAALLARPAADVSVIATHQWITDAPVLASTSVGDVTYLGGRFSYIAPVLNEGPSFVDRTTGAPAGGCATRTGTQSGPRPIVVADPSGGAFMQTPLADQRLLDGAGEFAAPSGESFVRIGEDCRFVRGFRLESFVAGDQATRGLTIARAGDLLYVGGTRTAGFGDAFGRVAAYNGTTGRRVNAWDYDRFRTVLIEGVTPSGQLVVTTTPRSGDGTSQEVGVLTPATGAFTLIATIQTTGFVRVIERTLYVVAGTSRALQAFDLATGGPKAGWTSPVVTATDLEAGGGRVFVAGTGLGRRGVFALSESTGELVTGFAPALAAAPGTSVGIERLALVDDRLFLRGRTLRGLDGASRYLFAAVSATTGAAEAWAPLTFAPTSSSIDLVPVGERLFVGRVFATAVVARRHLAAVNTATGAIPGFNPDTSVGGLPPVTALASNATWLFAGTSQGQVRRVVLATGGFDSWSVTGTLTGGAPGAIEALVLDGNTLYGGGLFTGVSSSSQQAVVARGHGAAVDATTAGVLPWDPRVVSTAIDPAAARRPIHALVRTDGAVVIGGDFTSVGGAARAGIGAVDPVSGEAAAPALTLEAGAVVLDAVAGAGPLHYVGRSSGGTPLIGAADASAGSITPWTIPDGVQPSASLAFFEGIVYSGPEWESDTGTPLSSGTFWTRPVAAANGLVELEEPTDGAEGPFVTRFHRATESGGVGAPRNLAVQYSGTEVYLTWRPPLRGTVDSYVVRAGPASGQSSLANFDTRSTEPSLWTRAPEGVYFVRVHARSAGGVSGPSNEVSFALVPFGCNAVPRAPGTLTAQGGDDGAALGWSAAIGATSYRIEAGSGPGRSDLAVLDVGNRVAWQTRAPAGRYFVRVRGANSCGAGAASNEVAITIGEPPPGPPANLRAVVTGRDVTLEWDAPATGPIPTFYQLEAGSGPGRANLAVSRTTGLLLVVQNVAPGAYYVRARAGNASGLSDPGPDVLVTITF